MTDDRRMVLAVEDGVARLRFTRAAKRNAIDERFLAALETCVDRVSGDRRVRVLLVEAEGPAFSAGFDLGVLAGIDDATERARRFAPVMRERLRTAARVLEKMAALPPVTVAAVRGAAAGGGFSLALACDLRVAATDLRCWYPEVGLGSALTPTSTRLLVRLVPAGVARDIIFTCRRLDADELLRLGLVNRVVAPEALDEAALELVRDLAAKPAAALLTSKLTVNALVAGHEVVRADDVSVSE
jgi:enoyl-CoA hydratase/carnithine racemase